MGFFKTAKVPILGSWLGDAPSELRHTARFAPTASHFLQAPGRVDIAGALRDVSDIYCISSNPADYLFTPVRANSVNVPNENGDGFSRQESLRFDTKIGRRVYQTYLLKPHHVNHRSDNPRMARGFIVDVHYNDAGEMPKEWRDRYEQSTGMPQLKDEFVEALLAVDTKKDPYLAHGIQARLSDAFSMGCECEKTRCNVCDNVAASKLEFCPHIRYGNKMKWFERVADKKKVQAFEWCEGVIYGELSSVDQPADPRAFRGDEVFSVSASLHGLGLSQRELMQIVAYAKVHEGRMPSGLEKLIEGALSYGRTRD